MDNRKLKIDHFLSENNLENADIQWLKSDASLRRYARLKTDKKTFILMDSPQSEKPEQFCKIDFFLEKNGFNVPKIYDYDIQSGLILMEDFGNNLYCDYLKNNPKMENELYQNAVMTLGEISKLSDLIELPPYDKGFFLTGLQSVFDWYIPAFSGKKVDPDEKNKFNQIQSDVFDTMTDAPKGMVLYDFQIYNIMWMPDRFGIKKCGLLDFQDGCFGPLAYDVISLLEDARREEELPIDTRLKLLNLYLEQANLTDRDAFMKSYHIMAVKRLFRCVGNFCRLSVSLQKHQYLHHIPMLWHLIESHLSEPYFKDFKIWLDKNIPKADRGIPPKLLKYV